MLINYRKINYLLHETSYNRINPNGGMLDISLVTIVGGVRATVQPIGGKDCYRNTDGHEKKCIIVSIVTKNITKLEGHSVERIPPLHNA